MLLNENSNKYIQPEDININLKQHQLAMLNKCLDIELNNEYAIMKDKPGSGKTYVVLTMIYELKKKDISNKNPRKTNVIVVPQNIYFQWSYSIERLTDNLSYLKFVEYEHLLNLYNEPHSLYGKDIILVTSSYYNSLASTMTSLELNVDRLFIDEIDNVGNFINQNFNTKFIMFISASFSFDNNNGFYTNKLKDMSEEDITIVCEENFIDKQINLEEPLIKKYLCKNIYVDKVLVDLINEEELRNINACYYKLNDKNFNNIIAKDEKNLISLIFNENKSVIDNFKNKIEDCEKNINYYEEKMSNKANYIDNFNIEIINITLIFNFKKNNLKINDNLLEYFKFYLNPVIEKEYEEYYDVIVSNRKNNLKEYKIYIHNLNEAIYNLYTLDLSDTGISEKNIDNLVKVFKIINGVLKNKAKEIDKFFDDIKKISENKKIDDFIIENIDLYYKFENFVLNFYDILSNLEIVLKSDNLLLNLKEFNIKCTEELNNYLKKKELLIEKLKKNDICPVCYEVFETDSVHYISECCNNNICSKCTEEWFNKYNKTSCIYCNTSNILLSSYLKVDNKDKSNNICNEDIKETKINIDNLENNNKYNNYNITSGSKIDYLNNFIIDLNNNDFKVIIFCDFNSIFQKLENLCKEHNIEFEDLEKGNINEIEKTVCNYKYGNSKILFANSSLFSCGMNFENSTHIIFVHKMDVNIIDQTIGRAQRLGRQNRLNIIYLEYENEIIENQHYKADFIEKKDEILEDSNILNNINDDNLYHLDDQQNLISNLGNIDNTNDEIELPDYTQVIDVNLDELISSLE